MIPWTYHSNSDVDIPPPKQVYAFDPDIAAITSRHGTASKA